MRGRVNIPPRTGGIVNGVVREYQVVEEGGISTGDYVEFGIQNSNMQLVVPYSSITDSRKPTGYTVLACDDNDGPRNKLFELSDGSKISFYCAKDAIGEPITVVSYQISEGQLTFSTVTIPVPRMGSAYSNKPMIAEISTNKFLYIGYASGTSFAGYYILNYDSFTKAWSYEEVTLTTSVTSKPSSCKQFLKIGQNLFMWIESSKMWLAELDVSTKTLNFINLLKMSTSDFLVVGIYGDYILCTNNTLLCTLKLENKTLSFVTSASLDSTMFYRTGWLFSKQNEDECLFITQSSYDTSGTSVTITLGAQVIKIVDGQMQFYNIVQKTFQVTLALRYNYNAVLSVTVDYKNGVLFGEIVYSGSSSSSSTTYATSYVGVFSVPMEISPSGLITFGEIDTKSTEKGYTASMSAALNVSSWYAPTEISDGVYLFGGSLYLLKEYRMYLLKPNKLGLSNLFTLDLIKKYATKISGIAKTSGSYGETIEVYAPE